MKYFTREWYERTQAVTPMHLPDCEAALQESKEYWRSEGRDYDEAQIIMFQLELPRLRKYVPEHLLELMDGGRLLCSVPPEEKAAPIREWIEEEMKRFDEPGRAYMEHFAAVEPFLPEGVRELLFHYPLHDAKLTAVLQLGEPGEMHMLMDYTGALGFVGWCTLVFEGVTVWELPEDTVDFSWIYTEVDVPEPGRFELQALLYPRMGPDVLEIRIAARDVRIEEVRQKEQNGDEEDWSCPAADAIWCELAKEWDEELGREPETDSERFREE